MKFTLSSIVTFLQCLQIKSFIGSIKGGRLVFIFLKYEASSQLNEAVETWCRRFIKMSTVRELPFETDRSIDDFKIVIY